MDLINLVNSMQPWMIPIVVMICLTLIVAITTIGGIIKAKIKQNSGSDLSSNKEFLDALREFKEGMERRVSNLEAIASGDDQEYGYAGSDRNRNKEKTNKTIDLDFGSQQKEEKQTRSGNLQNMLNR